MFHVNSDTATDSLRVVHMGINDASAVYICTNNITTSLNAQDHKWSLIFGTVLHQMRNEEQGKRQ